MSLVHKFVSFILLELNKDFGASKLQEANDVQVLLRGLELVKLLPYTM